MIEYGYFFSLILLWGNVMFGFLDVYKCFVSKLSLLIYGKEIKSLKIEFYKVLNDLFWFNSCFKSMIIRDIKDNYERWLIWNFR